MTNDFSQAAKEYVRARLELDEATRSLQHAQLHASSAGERLIRAKNAVFAEKWLGDDQSIRTALVGDHVVTLRRDGNKALSLDFTAAELCGR
jgi:hypothetical protein